MRKIVLILFGILLCIKSSYADEKTPIKGPVQEKWEETDDRDNTAPQLYQDDNYVYVYSEKQLDNLYIGITDTLGNVCYEEATTVPSCTYYAISIDLLPSGTYYLTIIQGSNYVMGIFTK